MFRGVLESPAFLSLKECEFWNLIAAVSVPMIVCEQTFPEKDELLRNMMGLMGNVAEVDYLRPHLMQQQYVSIFRCVPHGDLVTQERTNASDRRWNKTLLVVTYRQLNKSKMSKMQFHFYTRNSHFHCILLRKYIQLQTHQN